MTRAPSLTPSLTRRIVKQIMLGVPPEVAARMAGVPLDRFASWMTRKGRKYRTLQAADDQAEAQAIADYTILLRKAAKKGEGQRLGRVEMVDGEGCGALPAQAEHHHRHDEHDVARPLAQIKAVQAEQSAFIDPREKMLEEQREQQALADLEQGIISMVPDPALKLPA
jgi:hypothetical protein